MTRHVLTPAFAAALCLGWGCASTEPPSPMISDRPLFQQAPADGNGNKDIFTLDAQFPGFTTCASGAILDLHIVGWIQTRDVSQVPQGILPAHFDFIYSNAAGSTYVWHQVGAERFSFDENGNLILAVAGRLGYDGNIGRLVINLDTGELVSITGKGVFAEDLACAALT